MGKVPVSVKWATKTGERKTTQLYSDRLSSFQKTIRSRGGTIISIKHHKPTGGHGRVFYKRKRRVPTTPEQHKIEERIETIQSLPSKQQARKEYMRSGEIPEDIRGQIETPEEVKQAGLSEEYKRSVYEEYIGYKTKRPEGFVGPVAPSGMARFKNLFQQKTYGSKDWVQRHGVFITDKGEKKTWRELKKEQPALYLEKQDGSYTPKFDVRRWTDEYYKDVDPVLGGVHKFSFSVGQAFDVGMWSRLVTEGKGSAQKYALTKQYGMVQDIKKGRSLETWAKFQIPAYQNVIIPFAIGGGAGYLFRGAGALGSTLSGTGGKILGHISTKGPKIVGGAALGYAGYDVGSTAFKKGPTSQPTVEKLMRYGSQFGFAYAGYRTAMQSKPLNIGKKIGDIKTSYANIKHQMLSGDKTFYVPRSMQRFYSRISLGDSSSRNTAMLYRNLYTYSKIKFFNYRNIISRYDTSSNVAMSYRNLYTFSKLKFFKIRTSFPDYGRRIISKGGFDSSRDIGSFYRDVYIRGRLGLHNIKTGFPKLLGKAGYDKSMDVGSLYRDVYVSGKLGLYNVKSKFSDFRDMFGRVGYDTSRDIGRFYQDIYMKAGSKVFKFKTSRLISDTSSYDVMNPFRTMYGKYGPIPSGYMRVRYSSPSQAKNIYNYLLHGTKPKTIHETSGFKEFKPSNVSSGGNIRPVSVTVQETGFRMPSGYGFASGSVSLGFLEFLEEGISKHYPDDRKMVFIQEPSLVFSSDIGFKKVSMLGQKQVMDYGLNKKLISFSSIGMLFGKTPKRKRDIGFKPLSLQKMGYDFSKRYGMKTGQVLSSGYDFDLDTLFSPTPSSGLPLTVLSSGSKKKTKKGIQDLDFLVKGFRYKKYKIPELEKILGV